jgi:hypothetical protein
MTATGVFCVSAARTEQQQAHETVRKERVDANFGNRLIPFNTV